MAELGADLRQWAGGQVNRPVVDKTGLGDAYDFKLRWSSTGPSEAVASPRSSIFQALEAVGLRLVQANEPLAVLSVVSVSRTPTPNVPNIAELLAKATQFDAASLKPSTRGEVRSFNISAGGLIDAHAVPLSFLLLYGYTVSASMVVNAPAWFETDTYDLTAKAPSGSNDRESIRLMLRSLLGDRFQLKTHFEDQPRPAYVLTAPKHPPKLKESDGSVRSNCRSSAGGTGRSR
jgi:hypothetical protein